MEGKEEALVAVDTYIREQFGVKDVDIRTYSPLSLAYIGDCVFDLIVRSVVVGRGNTRPSSLHHRTSEIVRAHTQSEMIEAIKEELTEEELAVYRRGRNAKSYTTARHASIADYRRATGLEAVIGYLYLTDRLPRALELTRHGAEKLKLDL